MRAARRRLRWWAHHHLPGLQGWFRYYGTRVWFPPGSALVRRAMEQGVYEHANLLLLLRELRPGTTCVDVGASLGLLSVPLLRERPESRVLSLEASPNALPWLRRTREGSAFRERWVIVGKAAGAAPGRLPFFAAAAAEGAYDGLRDTGRGGPGRRLEVEATTVDAEWESLGRPAVSCLKIDVEGGELAVLRGAVGCLARERPFVLLEWNARNLAAHACPPESLLDFAGEAGFSVLSLPAAVPVPDRATLLAQMVFTESFALVPAAAGERR